MNQTDSFRIKVERELTRKKNLSTLVEILQKVQRLASSEQSSIHDIAKVVEADAVLTADVLRMVNSAFFGIEHKISSIDEAVVLLGFSHLRDLFSGLMMSGALIHGQCDTFNRGSLWRHSVGTAVAAESIKSTLNHPKSSVDLHLAGLLCNIGRVILDQRFPEEFRKALALATAHKGRLIDAEHAVFGSSHAEIGFWAAELWGFEPSVANLIKWHHGPAESPDVDVINLAYVVTQARLIGNPGDPVLVRLLPGVFKRLEIDAEKLDAILRNLDDSYESLNWIFKYIPLDPGSI